MAVSIRQLTQLKQQQRPIAVLTAWDFMSGRIADQAGVDVVLVGDSLAMVSLGYENTLPLTLDEMVHHAKAVRRGVKQALVIADLPFLSYQISPEEAVKAAGRMLKETNVQGVKLEGGNSAIANTVERLVQIGIPVMGHVGLTPQSINQVGGFRQQGKSAEEAKRILAEAKALQAAGAFCIVLEHIPASLAKEITEVLTIPTIGIGAGGHCDGQVLVMADVLGLSDWQPPFAKVYAQLQQQAIQAAGQFCSDVRSGKYPG